MELSRLEAIDNVAGLIGYENRGDDVRNRNLDAFVYLGRLIGTGRNR
jgi:hypothetical protein